MVATYNFGSVYMFCCTLLYVHSSFAISLMGKIELVALLIMSSWCFVSVVWLFLAVPWVCLQFVIVVFSDHTHCFFMALLACHRKTEFLTVYLTISYTSSNKILIQLSPKY